MMALQQLNKIPLDINGIASFSLKPPLPYEAMAEKAV